MTRKDKEGMMNNPIKRIIFTVVPIGLVKADSKTQASRGMKITADFATNSIHILGIREDPAKLLPLSILAPGNDKCYTIKEQTEKTIVIVPKDECMGNAHEIWALEDVIEFILEDYSIIVIEFIPEKELPYKPIGCQKELHSKYTLDKVIGSPLFSTKDKTVKDGNDLKAIVIWWNDNQGTLPKGLYQLTEWNGNFGIVILQAEIK